MGIFGPDYESAGVGIPKNAPKKKGIVRFFEIFTRKFWKLIQVNILYFIFCTPLFLAAYAFFKVSNKTVAGMVIALCLVAFTAVIGPATAGIMKILRNYTLEKHSFILKDFKEAFTKNYKKAFAFGLIDIIITLSIGAAFYVYPQLSKSYDSQFIMIPFIISISIGLMLVMMNFYAFLMIVATDISFKNILKNSFALACVALKKNLLTLLISFLILLAFALLVIWNMSMILFIPFVPMSFIAFVVCFNSYPVIQKYVINPYYEQRGEVNPELGDNDFEEDEVLFEDKGGSEKPIEKKKSRKKNDKKAKKGKIIS